jgi:hypothetical protein
VNSLPDDRRLSDDAADECGVIPGYICTLRGREILTRVGVPGSASW